MPLRQLWRGYWKRQTARGEDWVCREIYTPKEIKPCMSASAALALSPYEPIDLDSLPEDCPAEKRESASIINFEIASGALRVQEFTKAIQLDPTNSVAYYNRGVAYDKKGDLDRAIADYDHAIRLNPNHAAAYIYLGGLLARQGRLRQAEKIHRKATETCDDGCIDEAFLNLALVLRSQERFDEAAASLREAIQIDPEYRAAKKVLRDVERCRRSLRTDPLKGRWTGM